MKAKRGCWTCKDRKVQCDRALPKCQNCTRLEKDCQGYGLRLSWPRPNDKKRAIMGKPVQGPMRAGQGSGNFFINTTWWDVNLYRQLSQPTVMQPTYPVLPALNKVRHLQQGADYSDLLQYFHDVAYLSLVTFSVDLSPIRDLIMRMAVSTDTVPAAALLYALFAVSSLRRDGLHLEAVQFKIAALQALSTSAKEGALNSAEATQHVATCMLLCSFEIQVPSESSGEWLWYIWGAMDIIKEAQLESQTGQSDVVNLIEWVSYHDALSRFTMRHWRHRSVLTKARNERCLEDRGSQYHGLPKFKSPICNPSPAHPILNLLSEICDTLVDPWDPQSRDQDYMDRLQALEKRIRTLPNGDSTQGVPTKAFSVSVELYRLSTLIYLVRASGNRWETSVNLALLIDRAFAIPIKAPTCDHFFPLFILACEATTDERRTAILNLIDRNEKKQSYAQHKGT
ncbi:hypothetical protein NM208_g4379 [Fusarium decemcellulare]|uniref:Uncharacterized protein n=1 Tax=Fusarium decemcellulare TaxID=57161 RepID=A0ACC1SL79_9HYPO|nr:hypothetical protein NM208_g4379 [Fusarium decemcellulare]